MNRIDRLHAILVHLQSKKVVTAKEIAERFTISIRTVYRDIRALEEAGVPIGAEAGYGYYLDSTYHLPPVMFTNEEAGSIVLAGKFLEKFSDHVVNKHFENALYKIKAVLKTAGKEHLENLDSRVEILYPTNPTTQQRNLYLDKLQQSIAEKKKVKIKYHAQYKNTESDRTIEPIGLCYYSFNWHVIGYCHLRQDYRDFRLDRILSLMITSEHYEIHNRKNLRDYLDNLTMTDQVIQVKLKIEKDMYKYMTNVKYYYGFVDETEEEDHYICTFLNDDHDYMAHWIITMTDKVEILKPETLKDKTKELVASLQNHYFENH